MKKQILILSALALATTAQAQSFQEGYVNWGAGSQGFATMVNAWTPGQQVTEDDNFFISRVKPRQTFRNVATQVRPSLNEDNDKRLICWLPINNPLNSALPDGVYDSEVFTMWNYVSHWGSWRSAIGRIPGGFMDVAHKNGVAVSGVASIPNASLNTQTEWRNALTAYGNLDATKAAQYFRYVGINGMGYNSEFSGGQTVCPKLRTFHANLVKAAREKDPLFENIWYDGTNDNGIISFDQGLGTHNDDTFGDKDNVRTSLFLNYNWNRATLLSSSADYAKKIGRSPLDLYAGVNMQGSEPNSNNWPLIKDYPISIGLWGAHDYNMFWESRGEKGSAPDIKQRSYLLRTERWFTGGTRNPANCPSITESNKCIVDNFTFHGMSTFMTAHSTLKWNLAEEPFITYFNIGNGTFFNYQGQRQHSREWYNIAAQDYLPTWHFWFASRLLGGNASDVPASGLDAEFTWDDAWLGGSTLRIFGTTADEYLHLFKTEYTLAQGDVITFRYKLRQGVGNMNLVLTAKGAEKQAVSENAYQLLSASQEADEDVWEVRQFTVGADLAGKDLALVALHFQDAKDLDLLLGEFSLVRGTAPTPAQPQLAVTKTLSYSKEGLDAKIIWNMPNSVAAGEPCYNTDVNTAFFKVFAQQEGHDPILMGVTTSWAHLIYNVPVDVTVPQMKVRYGVSAVSLDHKTESPVAWSDYQTVEGYVFSDDIAISKTTIKPGEDFSIAYVDPRHESGSWTITDQSGNTVFSGQGTSITVADGFKEIGSYDLTLNGYVDNNGKRTQQSRTFGAFVQITGEAVGALPRILTLTANGKEADIEVNAGDAVTFAYTGRHADGSGSQGIDLKEERFGAKCADLGITGTKSFSVAFWLKINKLAEGTTQLLSIANKLDSWPKTDWGWIWCNVEQDGSMGNYTFRGTDASSNNELRYRFDQTKLPIGNWVHVGFAFEYSGTKFRSRFYVNGVEQKLTAWNRTTDGDVTTPGQYKTTDPGYQSNVYNITSGQVLAVGGSAHGRNGIDGTIDNLIVWDGAVDAATMKGAMNDINTASLASNVISFWNFEDKASSANTFTSVGTKKVAAGTHSYAATGGEGQGKFSWIASEYTSGCPFVSGTAYPVVTTPVWKAKKATLTPADGNDQQGSATATWRKGGDYEVTLTLQNSLGADTRTFSVITVKGGSEEGIASLTVDDGQQPATAYAVNGEAVLQFAESGEYGVEVYNAQGQIVAQRVARISSHDTMCIALGQSGTYIVRLTKEGRALPAIKLLNK